MDEMPEEIWACSSHVVVNEAIKIGLYSTEEPREGDNAKYTRTDRVSVPKGVREALEFYAQIPAYECEYPMKCKYEGCVIIDRGQRAREALRLIDGGG